MPAAYGNIEGKQFLKLKGGVFIIFHISPHAQLVS